MKLSGKLFSIMLVIVFVFAPTIALAEESSPNAGEWQCAADEANIAGSVCAEDAVQRAELVFADPAPQQPQDVQQEQPAANSDVADSLQEVAKNALAANESGSDFKPLAEKSTPVFDSLTLDSNSGYAVGDTVTISGVISNLVEQQSGQNIIIQFFDRNGTDLALKHTITALTTLTGDAANGYQQSFSTTYTWLRASADMVIQVTLPGDANNNAVMETVSTFVRLPTQVDISLPGGGIQVGVESDIVATVTDGAGAPIQSGALTFTLDGQDVHTTNVTNGKATFTHEYAKAGIAYNLTAVYSGSFDYASSSASESFSAAKGRPAINVVVTPSSGIVGQAVTMTAQVSGIAQADTQQYITFEFLENGTTLHTSGSIPLPQAGADKSGVYTHTFASPYPSLSIVARFAANENYESATGTVNMVVTAPGGGNPMVTPVQYTVLSAFPAFTGNGGRNAKIDADHSKFLRLLYNNAEVDKANYTNAAGSTVITLHESYLKTFANGTHTFRAEFTDGYAYLTLGVNVPAAQPTVTTPPPTPTAASANSGTTNSGTANTGTANISTVSPKTGDNANMDLYIMLVLAGAAAGMGIAIYRRRKYDCR